MGQKLCILFDQLISQTDIQTTYTWHSIRTFFYCRIRRAQTQLSPEETGAMRERERSCPIQLPLCTGTVPHFAPETCPTSFSKPANAAYVILTTPMAQCQCNNTSSSLPPIDPQRVIRLHDVTDAVLPSLRLMMAASLSIGIHSHTSQPPSIHPQQAGSYSCHVLSVSSAAGAMILGGITI